MDAQGPKSWDDFLELSFWPIYLAYLAYLAADLDYVYLSLLLVSPNLTSQGHDPLATYNE